MSVQVSQLDNGLRVATDTMPDAQSVLLGVWVGVGTRHEPWNANGVAHLVEHMMFKGTKTRSPFALSAAIENKGGSMNAYTTREQTAYYARVLPEEAENALDIIADMLRNSTFKAKELDRERQVIIQEIGRDLDSPEDYAFDLLFKLAMPGQKMGRSILGSADVIARLPQQAVVDYVERHYTAANMVVSAAGKIDHQEFKAWVEKRLGKLPRGKLPQVDKTRIAGGDKRHDKEIEQVHLILGFPGPGIHAREIYPTQVLSNLLGGSASSRLFQKVREKRGLVYTVSSAHAGYSDAGLFYIYAGTDPKRLRELVPVVCDELRDVSRRVTRGELARAKAQIRADILMGKESVARRGETLANQLLTFGKPIPAAHVLARLSQVDEESVQKMAAKLFTRKPILTALGPLGELESYRTLSERLRHA